MYSLKVANKVPLYQLKTVYPFRCLNEDNSEAIIRFKSWDDYGRSLWSKCLHEPERNLLIRFQWLPNDTLQFAIFQLIIGRLIFFEILCKKEEEPEIRRYIAEQYKIMLQHWKPIGPRG